MEDSAKTFTRIFSWIPSKFFNSRRQTWNFEVVTSSAQMLVASWTFFGGLVWITVRKTSGGGEVNVAPVRTSMHFEPVVQKGTLSTLETPKPSTSAGSKATQVM